MTILKGYPAKAVSSYRMLTSDLLAIHHPYLCDTYSGICFMDIPDILKCKLFTGCFCQNGIVIILIISLLAYANQSA